MERKENRGRPKKSSIKVKPSIVHVSADLRDKIDEWAKVHAVNSRTGAVNVILATFFKSERNI